MPDSSSLAVDASISLFGLTLANLSKSDALALMESLLRPAEPSGALSDVRSDARPNARPNARSDARPNASIFLVNAHTLNLAAASASYRQVLQTATYCFGDGTGVRWAARWKGAVLRANLVGTDLIPEFLQATANRGYRYFLLGADPETIDQAAQFAQAQFPGWELVGHHHGYLTDPGQVQTVVATLNAAQPDLLLVGMGNPLQEEWIASQQSQLQVPLAIGVGGLFDHWGGRLVRAPIWVRELGLEWLQILLQQPHKWRRYLIGNVRFLLRMVRG